jgi:hypothetical protein
LPLPDEYVTRLKQYRDRADEIRAVAGCMRDAHCRGILLRLADSYNSMIRSAENAFRREGIDSD